MDNALPNNATDLKIDRAKQERSNQISHLMGEHMLRGYRMLDRLCNRCDTILLLDRSGVDYCVYCNEISSVASKDDPVTNDRAANSGYEQVNRTRSTTSTATITSRYTPKATKVSSIISTTSSLQSTAIRPSAQTPAIISDVPRAYDTFDAARFLYDPERIGCGGDGVAAQQIALDEPELNGCATIIKEKIMELSMKLKLCKSASEILELSSSIKSCADCLNSIRNLCQ